MHVIIDGTTTQDQMAYAGVGQYTKSIILALVKNYPNTDYSVLLFDEKRSTIEPEIEKYTNVKIERIGKYRLNDYKNELWYYFQMLPKIRKIKKKESVYFCPYFWRDFPSFSMPTVLFIHDMNLPMFNMYSQQSFFHNFARGLEYWFALLKAVKCKYIVHNSQTTLDDFASYFPKYPKDKMVVSHLASDMEIKEVDLSKVLPTDYKKRGYIIYLGGGINKTKNTEGVINGYNEFLKLINRSEPPYLVIAGGKFLDKSNPEVKGFHKLIKKLGIKDSVIFSGFYEDDQKYSLLKEAIAFMHLSEYEGFGLSPLEAIIAKTPTIVHESKIYKEIFTDMAIFVDGKNAKEVGEKLFDVYTHPERYKDLIEKGYKLSSRYDWKETARITHEVFEKVEKEND